MSTPQFWGSLPQFAWVVPQEPPGECWWNYHQPHQAMQRETHISEQGFLHLLSILVLSVQQFKANASFHDLQEAFESLGISVVGGVGHPRGDIPIYVTNLQTAGCLGRTKLIQVSFQRSSAEQVSIADFETHSHTAHAPASSYSRFLVRQLPCKNTPQCWGFQFLSIHGWKEHALNGDPVFQVPLLLVTISL